MRFMFFWLFIFRNGTFLLGGPSLPPTTRGGGPWICCLEFRRGWVRIGAKMRIWYPAPFYWTVPKYIWTYLQTCITPHYTHQTHTNSYTYTHTPNRTHTHINGHKTQQQSDTKHRYIHMHTFIWTYINAHTNTNKHTHTHPTPYSCIAGSLKNDTKYSYILPWRGT